MCLILHPYIIAPELYNLIFCTLIMHEEGVTYFLPILLKYPFEGGGGGGGEGRGSGCFLAIW